MDTEVVGGEEAKDGEVTGVGGGTSVGSNTGMTETETEKETGAGGMEVGINQGIQAPIRDTTLIIRDHILTHTDLYSHLSGFVSMYSIHTVVLQLPLQYLMWQCATVNCLCVSHYHSLISQG